MPEQNEFITIREAAEILGNHEQVIYKYLRDGCFPRSGKTGHNWHVSLADVEMYQKGEASITWEKQADNTRKCVWSEND